MRLPQTIGPYRVLDLLGRGNMGVVYRAEHLESGRPVALKTVTIPREELLSSIRREIHALARTTHPGIVRIFEEGLHEGVPWYAMELVQGPSLRQVAESHGRAGFPRTLHLIRRLCAPLAYLHGEGIVHRDLKLDNVLVQPAAEAPAEDSGVPVLVDFGVAAQSFGDLSREELELSSELTGSLDTMAPEQVRGELVDARADLYALGCMVYEIATGRPPFVGSSAVQILRQHLESAPVPPSQLVANVPHELEDLILRLLAKDRRDRPGHAGFVADTLARLSPEPELAETGPKAKAYLYRPGLAGRRGSLDAMEAQIAELEETGRGGLTLIGGESGAGKTRLMLELGRLAARRELSVLAGECVERGARPLQALLRPLQQIADRCRERGKDETDRLLGRRGHLLARYEPALAGLPGQDEYREPADLPAAAALQRLSLFVAETFMALGAERPVLLMLDDLQWADDLALGALDLLVRTGRLQPSPMLVVGAYRSEEVTPRSSLLPALLESPQTRRIELGRLEEAAVASMVGDMLALASPPKQFVHFLSSQSEGNPFFVAELLRTAVAEELLARDRHGRWQLADETETLLAAPLDNVQPVVSLPLPRSLQELIGRRLQGLPEPALLLAQAAAVIGRESAAPLLQRMLRLGESEFLEAAAELLRRQVLEDTGPGLLRFDHDQIRRAAYTALEVGRQRDLHHAAAEGIEALQGRERRFAELGHHWQQAGDLARARECFLAGARDAGGRFAHAEAERLYRAYLALVRAPALESVEARNELGRAILTQGRAAEATQEHQQALEEARALGRLDVEAQTLVCLGLTAFYDRRLEEARALLERAARTAGTAGARHVEAQALAHIAGTHLEQGRLDEARSACQQALALNRELGDRPGEALTLFNLGRICVLQSSPEAVAFYGQALALHRELGDRRMQVFDLIGLATFDSISGRFEQCQSLYEQALALVREVGDRRMEGIVLAYLADNASALGRLDAARAFCGQALQIHRAVADRMGEVMSLQVLVAVERRLGALGAAEAVLEQSEPLVQEIGQAYLSMVQLCQRGHLALARGHAARAFLDQARELAATLSVAPGDQLGRPIAELGHALEAFDQGEPDRLFRGECVEDLPEGLRRSLRDK